ncbi:MAG TPA: hypothetical protein VF506_12650, partial [Streptosporangiaceae bacterium]
ATVLASADAAAAASMITTPTAQKRLGQVLANRFNLGIPRLFRGIAQQRKAQFGRLAMGDGERDPPCP